MPDASDNNPPPVKAADVIAATIGTERSDHMSPTLFSRPDRLHKKLYVICPIINATRARSRWRLFQDFERHVAQAGAQLLVVEVAFGDRDFVVTEPNNPHHIQLRTWHELWLKERAINLGVVHLTRLVPDWAHVAWLDGDFFFCRGDWANETIHLLQHYPVVQMWSQLINLTSDYEIRPQSKEVPQLVSFMSIQIKGHEYGGNYYEEGGQKFGSPGLAWAARREAWDQMGGLIDYCVLGAGDWYWANAVMGTLDKAIGSRNDLTPAFGRKMHEYQEHLTRSRWQERSIVGNAGIMHGLVVHFWHGSRADRQYNTRGEILMRHEYDPDRDLKTDASMLYQLTDRSPGLRREIQAYFNGRREDELS